MDFQITKNIKLFLLQRFWKLRCDTRKYWELCEEKIESILVNLVHPSCTINTQNTRATCPESFTPSLSPLLPGRGAERLTQRIKTPSRGLKGPSNHQLYPGKLFISVIYILLFLQVKVASLCVSIQNYSKAQIFHLFLKKDINDSASSETVAVLQLQAPIAAADFFVCAFIIFWC